MLPAQFKILITMRRVWAASAYQDCVKGGSPLVILTKDDRLYFPISAKRCPIRINGRYSCRLSASTCGRAGLNF